jgi:hypothetical protein
VACDRARRGRRHPLGLADLGYPELGSFSLEELASILLPFGIGIERDILFTGDFPISIWAEVAREAGNIRAGIGSAFAPPLICCYLPY